VGAAAGGGEVVGEHEVGLGGCAGEGGEGEEGGEHGGGEEGEGEHSCCCGCPGW